MDVLLAETEAVEEWAEEIEIDAQPDNEEDTDADADTLGDPDALSDIDGVPLRDREGLAVLDIEPLEHDVRDAVGDVESDGVFDRIGERVGVRDTEPHPDDDDDSV